MGLAGAMLPVAVKERFADRPGFATAVYTSGITIGSALAASVAVPLAHGAGGWRTPLLVFGVVSTRARRPSGSGSRAASCRTSGSTRDR